MTNSDTSSQPTNGNDNGHSEELRQSAFAVLLICGDWRLHGWRSIKAIQEKGLNPLGVKLGLIEEGEDLRFDCESIPGPPVPFTSKSTEDIWWERKVIATHVDKYASQFNRGERVILATHSDCGRIGRDGRNMNKLLLLEGLKNAGDALEQALKSQTVDGFMLVHCDDNGAIAVEPFTKETLNEEIARTRFIGNQPFTSNAGSQRA